MSQQIIIAEQARVAALLTDDRVDELIVAQGQYQIGDIFLGTVENVLPGIDAAFINIGGVIVVDFIDMESRRDQFQLLEHFTSAIKDDSARPQIAQLTELGLVELTRKRQGQNIYELFGKKCSKCNGTGHVENQLNHEIQYLYQIHNFLENLLPLQLKIYYR